MVLAFGLDHIIISTDRPKDPNASRYLENTATTRGKPSFTAEAGRSGPVDMNDATVLVQRRAQRDGHLKMTDARGAAGEESCLDRASSSTIAAEQDGMFHPAVDRDAHVTKGAKIGVGHRLRESPLQEMLRPRAESSSSSARVPSLKKGDTIASIGVVAKGR